MNEIIFDGRLTRDPEYKTGKKKGGDENYSLASICIANDDFDKKSRKGDNYEPNWIPVKLWGKNAEFVQKFCRKGTRVVVKGKLETDKYVKDGQSIYTWGVENAKIEFIDWSTVPDELRQKQSQQSIPPSNQGQQPKQQPPQNQGYAQQPQQQKPQGGYQQPQNTPQQQPENNAAAFADEFDFGSLDDGGFFG